MLVSFLSFSVCCALQGDLTKALAELDEFAEAAAAKDKKANKLQGILKKKKKKTERELYTNLADKVKKAIEELETQHKTTASIFSSYVPLFNLFSQVIFHCYDNCLFFFAKTSNACFV